MKCFQKTSRNNQMLVINLINFLKRSISWSFNIICLYIRRLRFKSNVIDRYNNGNEGEFTYFEIISKNENSATLYSAINDPNHQDRYIEFDNEIEETKTINSIQQFSDVHKNNKLVTDKTELVLKNIDFKEKHDKFIQMLSLIIDSNLIRVNFNNCIIPHTDNLALDIHKDFQNSRYLYSLGFINCEFEKSIDTVGNIASKIKNLSQINISENNFTEEEIMKIVCPSCINHYPELYCLDFVHAFNNKIPLNNVESSNLII